jgi:hypothetical protein
MGVMRYGAPIAPAVRTRRRWGLYRSCRNAFGLALAVSLTLSACRAGSSASKPTTTTALTSTTTTPTPSSSVPADEAERASIVGAYRSFWDDFVAASNPMDPASPRLETHATGHELAHLQTRFTTLRAEHIVIRGTIDLGARVASIDGDKAVIEDCHDASTLLMYDARTGELRDTVDTRRSLWRVQMVRTPAGWKVDDTDEVSKGCEPVG